MLHVLTEDAMHLHSLLCHGSKSRSHVASTLEMVALGSCHMWDQPYLLSSPDGWSNLSTSDQEL